MSVAVLVIISMKPQEQYGGGSRGSGVSCVLGISVLLAVVRRSIVHVTSGYPLTSPQRRSAPHIIHTREHG